MDMIAAARDTLDLAKTKGYDDISSDIPELDYPHVSGMVTKMEEGGMDQGKLGRWLGWLQAACVSGTLGAVTLEDCKAINRRHETK